MLKRSATWNPFRGNRTIDAQNYKRRRIVKAGLAGLSKEAMRELGNAAVQSSPVHSIPAGKRTSDQAED